MEGDAMKRSELDFPRPSALQAEVPPNERGLARDEIRLMVSYPTPDGPVHVHRRFYQLGEFFQAGDVLVVNHSATLPASLPAHGTPGDFILNLATHYGRDVWLAEPRWSHARPGPMPLS